MDTVEGMKEQGLMLWGFGEAAAWAVTLFTGPGSTELVRLGDTLVERLRYACLGLRTESRREMYI